ncbi:MAG TPA: deaminase [Ktedonobacterales bacterium]
MGSVSTGFSMSLDGFVAEPDDNVERVFRWYTLGGATQQIEQGGDAIPMNDAGAEFVKEAAKTIGALVTGRRQYEQTHGWGGKHPVDAPIVVVTHRPAPAWVQPDWPVTFIHEGVEDAILEAKKLAGEKTVAVASTTIVQQCLNLGLLDEIHIDLAPVLLSHGVALFANLTTGPLDLEITDVSPGNGVTHLTYRVVK